MSLISEVDRYVRLKRSLGYKFVDNEPDCCINQIVA